MIYELIIIGGGMSGLSVGHFFRDQRILILEKGALLSGATGKNAGFLIGGFGEHFSRTVSRLGLARAAEIQEIHCSNHRRIRDLTNLLAASYHPSGSLCIGLDDREIGELRASHDLLRQAGFDVEWMDHAESGLRQPVGALFNRDDAWIDPLDFWSKLAATLPVREHTKVLNIENRGSLIEIETIHGAFQTERIVICLDAFSADLVPELQGKYIPLRGQILEAPMQRAKISPPVMAQHGDIYWRIDPGKLIFGGLESSVPSEEIGIAKQPSKRIEEHQLDWIRRHLSFDALGPPNSRCGTMAFTVDGFPFVGQLPQENRYVLSGTCGLGHSYTLEAASWLYELIVTGVNKIPVYFSSDRISNLPAYTDGNWRSLYEAWNY